MSEEYEWDNQEQFNAQRKLIQSANASLSFETLLTNVRGHWVFHTNAGRGLIFSKFTADLIRMPDGWLVVGTASDSPGPGRTAFNLRYFSATDTLDWTAIGLRHTFASVSSNAADVQVKADMDTKTVAVVVRAYRIPFQGSIYELTNGSYLVASEA